MNTARNSKTKRIYSANQFEKLSPSEKSDFRRFLECEVCKERAFFRSKSRDGRTAHFYSEHKVGCSLKNSKKSQKDTNEKIQENKKESSSDIFGIRWTDLFKLVEDENSNDLIELYDKKGPSKREYVKEPSHLTQSKLSLAKILHYAKNKILTQQDIRINLDNRTYRIDELVYHAHYIKKHHEGRVGFYWGYLNSCDNDSWLNINRKAPFDKFSIQLEKKLKDIFWRRMGTVDIWKESVPFIVFGKLLFSPSGKPFIIVTDTKNLYIDKRSFNKNTKK